MRDGKAGRCMPQGLSWTFPRDDRRVSTRRERFAGSAVLALTTTKMSGQAGPAKVMSQAADQGCFWYKAI